MMTTSTMFASALTDSGSLQTACECTARTSAGPCFQTRSPATPSGSWLTAITSGAVRIASVSLSSALSSRHYSQCAEGSACRRSYVRRGQVASALHWSPCPT